MRLPWRLSDVVRPSGLPDTADLKVRLRTEK